MHNKNKSTTTLFYNLVILSFVITLLTSTPALAGGLYTELDAAVTRIKVEDIEYKPHTSKFKLGYEINQYALEFQFSGGTGDDEVEQQTVEIDNQMGLYFRVNFNINPRSKLFLNFGAARTTVLTTVEKTETSKEYDDYSYSFGVEDYFPGVKALNLAIEYTELYKDKDVDIESLSLGIRYTF